MLLLWACWPNFPTEIISDNDVRLTIPSGFFKKACTTLGVKVSHTTPYRSQSNGFCERTNRAPIWNSRVFPLNLKTIDWPYLLPMENLIHNSQVLTNLNFHPTNYFLEDQLLGFPDPETPPLLQNWISHQLSQNEVVIQRLQYLRSKSLSQQSRERKPHRFIPNKFALIHGDLFPNQKHPKIASPWLRPL